MSLRLFLFALLLLTAGTSCDASGFSATNDLAREIEGQVWSPYCPGRLLADCPTAQARDLRDDIADRVDRGDTKDEILAWVRSDFGDEAVAEPDTSPTGLIIWLVPVAIFAVGLVLVIRRVRARPAAEL